MSQKRVRVGVIGLGVGEQHLLGFLQDSRCEVTTLCDLTPDHARAVAHRLGAAVRVTDRAEEILLDPDVDAVSLATYDQDHADQTCQALETGKHVFVEKPLCRTAAELHRVYQAWSRQGGRLKLASNLVLRSAPVFTWLRDRVQEGQFGRTYAFDGDYLYGRIHKITAGWRGQVEEYSVMEGGGIHLLDLFLWITGERPATVQAVGNRICTEGTAFRYDDFATALLQCPSGLVARITANFGCVHRHFHVVRLFGTRGTFVSDDQGPRIHTTRDEAVQAAPLRLPVRESSKAALIPEFVEAIVSDRDWNAETRLHFDVLSVCLACDRARQTQAPVGVEYV